jgi:hypothetical protein
VVIGGLEKDVNYPVPPDPQVELVAAGKFSNFLFVVFLDQNLLSLDSRGQPALEVLFVARILLSLLGSLSYVLHHQGL